MESVARRSRNRVVVKSRSNAEARVAMFITISFKTTMLQKSLKLIILNALILIYTAYSLASIRDKISVFVVVLGLTFFSTGASCVLPIHRRIWKSELSQYEDLRKHGVVLRGKITFSGNTMKQGRDVFLAEGELRYRMIVNDTIQEISKEYVATRTYQPESGTVEAVEVIVLPDSPRSGVEPNHSNEEADRIKNQLISQKWYLSAYTTFSLVMWPFFILEARKEDKMFLIYIYLAVTASLSPAGLVAYLLRPKPSSLWFWTCFVYSIYAMDVATMAVINMRLGNEFSLGRVEPVALFATFFLLAAIRNRKTVRQDILDPVDNVTVADVCLNDIDCILDCSIKQPTIRR